MTTTQDPPKTDPPKKDPLRKRTYTPILFVIFTLIAWYVFQLLARVVITCLPGGEGCLLRRPEGLGEYIKSVFSQGVSGSAKAQYLYNDGRLDALVSVLTLLFAVWAISRFLFPGDDFSSPQPSDDTNESSQNAGAASPSSAAPTYLSTSRPTPNK